MAQIAKSPYESTEAPPMNVAPPPHVQLVQMAMGADPAPNPAQATHGTRAAPQRPASLHVQP